VLEEPAQVRLFLPGDQQLGQIRDGLEAHVPQEVTLRLGRHGLFHDADARQGHLHDAEGTDLAGGLRSVDISENRAPVVAEHGYVPQAQVVAEGRQVGGHGVRVVAGGRLGRIAEAPQVRRHHLVLTGQQVNDVPPFVPGLRPAVQKHDGRALAGRDVVQPGSVDLGGVMGGGYRCHRGLL